MATLSSVTIVKRDKTREDFSLDKIDRVVRASGLTDEQVTIIRTNITSWIASLKRHEVTSVEVRDKVAEELKALDLYAYNLYMWYQKVKDKGGLNTSKS
jgi:transcriptional regulator NrdR family protein